jgi:hypothetical protein
MPRLAGLALLLALPLTLSSALAPAATSADRTASSGGPIGELLASLLTGSPQDQSAILQRILRATDEEWSILYPKLVQVTALRAAVAADGASAEATSLTRRLSSGPMGGTSMDAPTMAGRGGRFGGRTGPFDPAAAPGARAASSGLGAALTRGLARNWANSVKTGQGNSVQILLNELQTLLDDKNSTDKQLFDKLSAIRSARAKAARDLEAAQTDFRQLLTTDQLAILVSLGYLD